MDNASDMELLQQYAQQNSDAAFSALVARHINLIYSAALRKSGNPSAAEEITQVVFIILAQKARRISAKTILTGWLYQTARLTAASFLKSEMRRTKREQQAYMQTERSTTAPDETWARLAPLLEDAMEKLGENDRTAVVLRFFGGKSFAEVAARTGVSENAAKKRVSHALKKLNRHFSSRGISSTAARLADAISSYSIQSAPDGLAKSVAAGAAAKGAAATGSTLSLIKEALKIMAWTKAKTSIVTGAAALLIVGATTLTFHYYPAAFVDFLIFSRTKNLSGDEDSQYARWTGTTPEQAAQTFFEACGQENWAEVARFWNEPGTRYPLDDKSKEFLGGLQLVSLGKPFWAWTRHGAKKFGGVFVPYEIRFKNGGLKRFHLEVRCDNPDKRWYVDGGL